MADDPPFVRIVVDMLSPGAEAWVRDWSSEIAATCDDAVCSAGSFRARYFDAESGYTEATSAIFIGLSAIARHEPMVSFGGVGSRRVQVHIALIATGGSDAFNRQVVNPLRWLDALRYPTAFGPPPAVRLFIGNSLAMRCVLSGLSPEMCGPFDEYGTPAYAQVTLSFVSLGLAEGVGNSTPYATRNQGGTVGHQKPGRGFGVTMNYQSGAHAAEV